jgi:hypothetical protein
LRKTGRKGVVSDNAGMPIPGVSVLVKGTKFGTQTDFDGKYAINASPSQILLSVTWDENPRIKSDVITCVTMVGNSRT